MVQLRFKNNFLYRKIQINKTALKQELSKVTLIKVINFSHLR